MSQLLQNAAYGTIMILVVMLLRRVLKDRLSPGARLALWGACLFRLLTPAAPESVLSLWGLVGRLAPVPAEMGAQGAPMPAPAVTGPAYVLEPGMPVAPAAPVDPSAVPANPAAAQAAFPWGTVLTAVWLAVGIAVAVWYLVGWVRARRAVHCAIPVGEDDPRRRFLPRFAQLREGPVEGAPLTFGVVRPQVVLSPGLDAGELACVLAHEGVHARRRDNLWHYAMAAALVVHWWNPAVRLMARLLRRDIELACDRAALKKLGEDRRAEYAQALVTLSTQGEGNGPAFCQTFGRKATEERIRSIMKFKKPTIIGVILTLVLVLGVTIAFASDPKAPEDDKQDGNAAVDDYGAENLSADGDPAGEYDSEFRCSVYYDGTVVTRVVIPLSMLEEELDIRMKDNSISNAEATLILTQARSIAVDGVIDWTFTEDNGLRHEELPEESIGNTTVSANGYWDKDGQFVKVRFAEIVRDFILPQALMGEDTGVEYGLEGYTVVEPEVDAQGNSLVYDADGNLIIVGVRGVHSTPPANAANCTPQEYAAALDAWVTQGAMTRQEADEWLEIFQTCYDRVQAGDSDAFRYNTYDGTKMSAAWYISERAAQGYPVNSKGETYGSEAMAEIYGTSPDLVLAMGTNGEEGYIRWSDDPGSSVRNPDEAMIYMEWQKTQRPIMYMPLYDCEGNVIGRFSHGGNNGTEGVNTEDAQPAMDVWLAYLASIPAGKEPPAAQVNVQADVTVYPECHVDGCNTVGQHMHNGVTYCNISVPASTASGGHHEENHHGNGHH